MLNWIKTQDGDIEKNKINSKKHFIKMKNNYIIVFILGCLQLLITSCSVGSPLDDEQYVKQVYLVGAHDKLQTKELSYNGDGNLYVSAALGGSLTSDKDVSVTLGCANQSNIILYNHKNVIEGDVNYQALPSEWYNLPSWSGTIRGGDVYTRIPIHVLTNKIDCDSLYVIPLKIISTSLYNVVKEDTVLMINLKMTNNYSGLYVFDGTSTEYEDGKPNYSNTSVISTTRNLTAVNGNTVRLFQNASVEKQSNLQDNAYTLTVNADSSVMVKPWKDLTITDGGGTYDTKANTFNIWYFYTSGGKIYKMVVKLVKSITNDDE